MVELLDFTKATYNGGQALKNSPRRHARFGLPAHIHDGITPVFYVPEDHKISGTVTARIGQIISYNSNGEAQLWVLDHAVITHREHLKVAQAEAHLDQVDSSGRWTPKFLQGFRDPPNKDLVESRRQKHSALERPSGIGKSTSYNIWEVDGFERILRLKSFIFFVRVRGY